MMDTPATWSSKAARVRDQLAILKEQAFVRPGMTPALAL